MEYSLVPASKLVENNRELFVGIEFDYTDFLLKEVLGGIEVNLGEVVLVISLDETKPVYGLKDSILYGRFNGRFFPPEVNKSGIDIGMSSQEWYNKIYTILKEKNVAMGANTIPIKFTFYDKIIDLKK
jgi:hypothetical protein